MLFKVMWEDIVELGCNVNGNELVELIADHD